MAFDLESAQRHVAPGPLVKRAAEVPQIDPRDHDPNTSPPVGSVGPQSSPGDVLDELLPPPSPAPAPRQLHAEAWDGWPTGWGTPPLERAEGSGDWSGFGYGRHDPGGYLGRVSTAMTCVDLNSSQLASFPTYGVRGLEAVTLPSWSENPQPEMYADWSDFVMALVNALQLTGDGIVWATARNAAGYPSRFVALNPVHVGIEPDGRGGIDYLLGDEPLDPADVCHIRYQVLPGRVTGLSPIEWAYSHLVALAALNNYATDIARHGVWAVLRHPANLNTTQRDDLRDNWQQARAAGGGAPAILSGGVELDVLSLSPADMALMDLSTMNEQRICAAFRVPPYLVGVDQPGSLTYANASTLTDHHWRVGLRTLAKKIATALSAWALPHGTRLEFDRDEYVRPGPADRASYYATLAGIEQNGEPAMTIDEIRVAERLRPTGSSVDLLTADPGAVGSNP